MSHDDVEALRGLLVVAINETKRRQQIHDRHTNHICQIGRVSESLHSKSLQS